ncbi:hypothetical protein HDZ31DRAFT_64208 [Schizophyllum fasciatum]
MNANITSYVHIVGPNLRSPLTLTATFMIGPELPPHLQRPRADDDGSSDDEDAFLPELPPDLKPSTSRPPPASSSNPTSTTPPSSKPAPPASRLPPPAPAPYDDDSDDDVGPKPLGAPHARHDEDEGIRRFLEVERRRQEEAENASKPQALKRESWMLVPPTSSELLANIDPTKRRTFSTSTAPRASGKAGETNLWTETPQERLQRLKDEVDGRRKRAVNPSAEDENADADRAKRRKVEEEYQQTLGAGVEEYTKKIRGPSLTDVHLQKEKAAPKRDSSEPEAIWDRERDLGVGGRIFSDGERKKALNDARAGLGDRFGSGKGGRFM